MVISKRVGRVALDALGTAPEKWSDELWDTATLGLGWYWGSTSMIPERQYQRGGPMADTLLCWIAALAEVKP